MIQDETLEKSVFEEIPTEKIYSKNAIIVWTFFCGPLVTGYCMAENFKVFNDFNKARNTWILTLISTAIIIKLVFIIPENVPSIIFPVFYLVITTCLVKIFQEKDIQAYLDKGGEIYSRRRSGLVGLISMIVFFAAVVTIELIVDNI